MRFGPNRVLVNPAWAARVGQVFDTRPRIGVENVLWMRRTEEIALARALRLPGVHVCLDGPSGAGKTSLMRTILAAENHKPPALKHIYAKIHRATDWSLFKRQIIATSGSKVADDDTPLKLTLAPIPAVSLDTKLWGGKRINQDLVEKLDVSQLAKVLIEGEFILVIDDLDLGTPEFLGTVADLCKEVSDHLGPKFAKVAIVGTDDIYKRLLNANRSLRDRVDEITMGSLTEPQAAWTFITTGLQRLGLLSPSRDKYIKNLEACKQAVSDAADGLPKSIVRLGSNIALEGDSRGRVSDADIQRHASAMIKKHFHEFRRDYRELEVALGRDMFVRNVCRWMFSKGVGKIHCVTDMVEDLRDSGATSVLIDDALATLVASKFLVRTGEDDEVFFAREPLFAHTLGVALTSPEKCGVEKGYFGENVEQLLLKFTDEMGL